MKNKPQITIFYILLIPIFGFILLNIVFIIDFLYQSLIDQITGLFAPPEISYSWTWYPPLRHILFMIIIGLVSWLVLRTKLKPIYKAIFITIPSAVVLVTVGMFLSRWPVINYAIAAVLVLATFFIFYRTKQPWLYYYAVALVAAALLIMNILGVDI